MQIGTARALSVRQQQTLGAVRAHYAALGRPPSYKELGARLGVEKSQADNLVKACERLGSLRVVRRKGVKTEIRLTRPLEEVASADLVAELASRGVTLIAPTGNDPEELPVALAA